MPHSNPPAAKPTSRRFREPQNEGVEMSDLGIPVSAHFGAHTVLVSGRRIAISGSQGKCHKFL